MSKILIILNNFTHFFLHKISDCPSIRISINKHAKEEREDADWRGLAATGYQHKTVGTCEVANLITCKCAEILNV